MEFLWWQRSGRLPKRGRGYRQRSLYPLLAREIHADILVITTGVEKSVSTLANRSSRRWIGWILPPDPLYAGRAFPAGQHVAKNHPSLAFLEQGGKEVIITTPECCLRRCVVKRAPILLKRKDVSERKQ